MALSTTCPGCNATLQFDDSQANMQGVCPGCGANFTIPITGQPQRGNPYAPVGRTTTHGYATQDNVPHPGNPYAAGQALSRSGYGTLSSGVAPHRGGVVLTLGIVGLSLGVFGLCIFVFGAIGWICCLIAWILGYFDLRAMRLGNMDAAGLGITQAGMICGMIGTILGAMALVVFVLIMFAAVANAGL